MPENPLSATPATAPVPAAAETGAPHALRLLQEGTTAGMCTGDHCVMPTGGGATAG
ncbi:hypothetical protein Q9R19_03340 [Microbacterium sp. ARD32]|uniref:hypothetical protein n=1 Tax=Microbacterium sp. ARD32 TaxID=2962577 RepID=UPI002882182C|nr:hypothetical protein [Microbacterium sp. ARD32]MDT0156654.1 hypothetical protein [Microbacterium sp. ARD32]